MSQLWGSVPRWECCFPISLDSSVFAGWSSLPSPAGPPAPSSLSEAPPIVAASGLGDCRGDDARIVLFTGESRYESWGASLCGPAPVVPALPGATPACGDTQPLGIRKLHQGLCNTEGWGCPGQLPLPELPCDSQTPQGSLSLLFQICADLPAAWQGTIGVPGGALVALVGPFRRPPSPGSSSQGIWGWKGLSSPGHRRVHV